MTPGRRAWLILVMPAADLGRDTTGRSVERVFIYDVDVE
jgi:hypothetical protein